ncbi:MAG: DUF3604 domain-containing protein [Halioglobus sp.]
MTVMKLTTLPCLLALAISGCSQDTPPPETEAALPVDTPVVAAPQPEATPEPAISEPPPSKHADRVLWGDTHLHTSFSMDAGLFGNRLPPEDAYRFAKGESVTSSTGIKAQLQEPLDFLVVSDHSDNLGFFPKLVGGDPQFLANETGKRWYDMVQAGGQESVKAALELVDHISRGTFPPELAVRPGTESFTSAWESITAAAEAANSPGEFTAMIGYEWTSLVPPGANMHRVVIYRDGAELANQVAPYTTEAPEGSPNPRDLWRWLGDYEAKTGGKLLAIAHNGNLSNGIMFPTVESYDGGKVDKAYAETRMRWEPLYEITQIKGDGETHPFLSPNDEFADFGSWDIGNLNASELKKDSMLKNEYAREALKIGLEIEQREGVNPYKFGVIGSTDSHTSLATADDNVFFGKHSGTEPGPKRLEHPMATFGEIRIEGWDQLASGYAGVWATANTREAIFDAMMRKEVYATTGPRMTVRFFGGWDYSTVDLRAQDLAQVGYALGVPMGGELPANDDEDSPAPNFLISAQRDPNGANLDRVQVVKGWLDADGVRQEQVYNVAWSSGGLRKPDEDGKIPPVGNTVDLAKASYENSIGSPQISVVWSDPDFDPAQPGFYYVRVLEIPTPRWPAFDVLNYGAKIPAGMDEDDMVAQQRAYSSPIWYTP